MRSSVFLLVSAVAALAACVGNNNSVSSTVPPPPTANTVAVVVDMGPIAGTVAVNHPYVTVKVCVAGSTKLCASIDHVLLDTGSTGLRIDQSVLTANALTLAAETDAQGNAVEECLTFGAGQTWGPVVLADITMAGETASKVPIQAIEAPGSGTAPPAPCGTNGQQQTAETGLYANGILGVGVLVQDCGSACVSGTVAASAYYGCTSAGACTAESVALAAQVTNPVTLFAADNNGIVLTFPDLVNANGDASIQGQLLFGIGTQADNALPQAVSVFGADSGTGDIQATYNGTAAQLPALFDTGTDSYFFNDPNINGCVADVANPNFNFTGYDCPAVAPLSLTTVNMGQGSYTSTNAVNFAIADPHTFVQNAAAVAGLGSGGGATNFIWGMPFFYGRTVYFGFEQKTAGSFTGPFYAY